MSSVTPVADRSTLASPRCLEGEVVAFTGTLASMTHEQAGQLAVEHGGTPHEHVSRQTTLLVVGEEGWPLEDNGEPSVKFQQAERWRAEGALIRFLTETEWLKLLGHAQDRDEAHRLYTPAMLSQLLDVGVPVIRSWERAGLIRPVKRVYRLPYYDFQEVTSARRLSDLMQAGVSQKSLEAGLRRLPSVQRGDHRPLEQLEILARHSRVVVRDQHGLVDPARSQRVFDFETLAEAPASEMADEAEGEDSSPATIRFEPRKEAVESRTARDWFDIGCRLYDDGQVQEAIEAYRMSLMNESRAPETQFHLAECLYRLNNPRGALERYYTTVEQDHEYVEAWTQIGCLHRELGEPQSALVAFEIALDVHAEYPDAHFHKAETLVELGRTDEAIPHWTEYLRRHSRGPSADIARQRLEAADRTELPGI